LLLTNISQLITLRGPSTPRRGNDLSDLGLVKDGAVLCEGSKILVAGKEREVLQHPAYKKNKKTLKDLNCSGKTVLPGFVDSHTHPAFIHPRLTDFEMRTQGESYQNIAAAGGGILSSVNAVRKASRAKLTDHVLQAFERMSAHGTTTIEAKSGYGLSLEAELKSLEAIRAAAKKWKGTVRATLLGAHVVPKEFKDQREKYVHQVLAKMIPAASNRKLADFVDVFCEEGAFTLEETQEIFSAAKHSGLVPRAHVGQFSPCALSALLEYDPASLDHMDHFHADDIGRLAKSNTIATLLPGATYFLGHTKYPDVRKLIEHGVAVALATDFNPGTSPTPSMPFIMALACTQMRMSPVETICAATINGAHALRLADQKGSLEAGKDADIAIFKCADHREICYWVGENLCDRVIVSGK
jgi:imidazolonepropionase